MQPDCTTEVRQVWGIQTTRTLRSHMFDQAHNIRRHPLSFRPIQISIYLSIYLSFSLYLSIYLSFSLSLYIYIYIYIFVYIYIYIYIYMYV